MPDVSGLSDPEVLTQALALVDDGLPFHAHEMCEQRWRTCSPDDRELWRGLAQWGAAETHAARGNGEGARRLAQRALAGLSGCDTSHVAMSGIDRVRARCLVLA